MEEIRAREAVLTAQLAAAKSAAEGQVEGMRTQLAVAQAAEARATAAAADTTDKARIEELERELEKMRVQLAVTEAKSATRPSDGEKAEVAGLRTKLAAAEKRAEEVEEIRAREAALTAQLAAAQADKRAAEARAEELTPRLAEAPDASQLSAAGTRIAELEEDLKRSAVLCKALSRARGLADDEVAVKRELHESLLHNQIPCPADITTVKAALELQKGLAARGPVYITTVKAALKLQKGLAALGLKDLSLLEKLATFNMKGKPKNVVAALGELIGPLQQAQETLLLFAGGPRKA